MSTDEAKGNGRAIVMPEGAPPLSEKAVKPDGTISWKNVDSPVEHAGFKIILPAHPGDMPLDAAIAALEAKRKDEEQIMKVAETIDAHPMDGAVAFTLALKHKYGWA